MAVDGSNRKLVLGLAGALGGALLVIAFLLGRETNRSAPSRPAVEKAPPPVPDLKHQSPRQSPVGTTQTMKSAHTSSRWT